MFAGWVAPHNPFDLTTLVLDDARKPPAWMDGGTATYLLGTDDQGRDILSALMYGARISLVVGGIALASMVVGALLYLLGRRTEAAARRGDALPAAGGPSDLPRPPLR